MARFSYTLGSADGPIIYVRALLDERPETCPYCGKELYWRYERYTEDLGNLPIGSCTSGVLCPLGGREIATKSTGPRGDLEGWRLLIWHEGMGFPEDRPWI